MTKVFGKLGLEEVWQISWMSPFPSSPKSQELAKSTVERRLDKGAVLCIALASAGRPFTWA